MSGGTSRRAIFSDGRVRPAPALAPAAELGERIGDDGVNAAVKV